MSETRLPSEWLITNLEIIGEVVTGKTPSKKNSEYFGGAIPFIKPGDVNDQGNITFTEEHITELGASTVPTIPKESIVVTCIGNLGRCGITTERSATNQQINSVLPNRNVDVKFIYYQLRTLKEWMISESSATTVTIINKSKFSQAPLVLSPLAEQKVIADKLDTLLAQVDNTKVRLERIPEILKSFRQSVLAAAVSGKLVTFSEPKEVTVGCVTTDIRYGTSKKCDYDGGKTPVIRIPNIGDRKLNLSDLKYADFTENELETLALKAGDILVIRSNGSLDLVAKPALVDRKTEGFLFAGYLIRLRCNKEKVLPSFLLNVMSSRVVRDVVEISSRSTSGVNNINSKELSSLHFILPSLTEQTEIVRRVEELFAYADRIEQSAQAAQSRVNNLTQSILAKAFRGELTADWRAANPDLISGDNSAKSLLAKIKAERAKVKTRKKD